MFVGSWDGHILMIKVRTKRQKSPKTMSLRFDLLKSEMRTWDYKPWRLVLKCWFFTCKNHKVVCGDDREQLQNTPQLIYMSLNKNSVYCVMPRSSKPPDTCKWGRPKLRGILKFSRRSWDIWFDERVNLECDLILLQLWSIIASSSRWPPPFKSLQITSSLLSL